jgi:hypothetical protein
MQGFVQAADRQQTTLLPECLDDWVDESNPVRAVDVLVDALDLRDLGDKKRFHTAWVKGITTERLCWPIPTSRHPRAWRHVANVP